MTNQQHPITPPPELVQQWIGDYYGCLVSGELSGVETAIAARAAQWGADQELEACCDWIHEQGYYPSVPQDLRAARRPKLLSLKEQALALIDECTNPEGDYLDDNALSTIRRALESIND